VTGFSVTKGSKMMERTLNVLGNGTLMASVSVNHGTLKSEGPLTDEEFAFQKARLLGG
jgi:hypothetical protein